MTDRFRPTTSFQFSAARNRESLAAGTFNIGAKLMNGELNPNAQAILLLTAPLLIGKSKDSMKPLSLTEYNKLAWHLRETGQQPQDLFDSGALRVVKKSWPKLDIERVHRLLERGFLLAQVVERWRARGIWVVTRVDKDFPHRLKKRMREKAPPVLYGCGNRGLMEGGGLAVVGSRHVNDDLIRYTEGVGSLAAEADLGIVSGGAHGVDQAAMRGALTAGGRALGVLSNSLERAALNRNNRAPLMEGRLLLISPYDPAIRFQVWNAMDRNKLIYALADSALVMNSDHGKGGTWAGATEQLDKLNFVTVYVRSTEPQSPGLEALQQKGALQWPDPRTPAEMREIMSSDGSPDLEPSGLVQLDLFRSREFGETSQPVVRESAAGESRDPAKGMAASLEGLAPNTVNAGKKLLPVMTGKMTRKDICNALGLNTWGNVRERYVNPCLDQNWIEMTIPKKPKSPNQRFRRTPAGRTLSKDIDDV